MTGHPLPDNPGMEAWDQRAQTEFSLPGLVLMERAALSGVAALCRMAYPAPLIILAGAGNNGGDALAMARLLAHSGQTPRVFLVPSASGRFSDSNLVQQKILSAMHIPLELALVPVLPGSPIRLTVDFKQALTSAGCLVDGLLGVGLRKAPTGPLAELISAINRMGLNIPVVALDLPSGLYDGWEPGQPVMAATQTICFGFAKRCLYQGQAREQAGQIQVADCGFPRELPGNDKIECRLLEPAELAGALPRLAPDIHKHDRGVVSIVAGSPDFPGAALLCARAAASSRAGLVRLYLDAALRPQLAPAAGSLVLPVEPILAGNALVIGPGWGRQASRVAALRDWLGQAAEKELPVIVDADALFALATLSPADFPLPDGGTRPWVFTPHTAELANLAHLPIEMVKNHPMDIARQVAAHWSCTVILKGAVSLVAQADGLVSVIDSANPVLASAGSGDVFAGICGAVVAALRRHGLDAVEACHEAACLAPLIMAQAGLALASAKGWASAEALVDCLPGLFAAISAPETINTQYNNTGY